MANLIIEELLTIYGELKRWLDGPMFIDPANTQSIPGWARLDIGARYRFNKAVIVRAHPDNVFDKSNWDANPFGQLTVSDPRTFSLSTTFDF